MSTRTKRCFRFLTVTLATAGMVLPLHALQAAEPGGAARPAAARVAVLDVALDADGVLSGVVQNAQGQPEPNTVVVIGHEQGKLAQTTTDAEGRFAFQGVRGGTYRLATGTGGIVCRVWTAEAAPPVANDGAMIVTNEALARGQYPISELFLSDPILIGLIIAAAIAIPVAIHNSKSDKPSGS